MPQGGANSGQSVGFGVWSLRWGEQSWGRGTRRGRSGQLWVSAAAGIQEPGGECTCLVR